MASLGALSVAMPELAAPPLKAHTAAHGGLSQALRTALREESAKDPDLSQAIDMRRSLTTDKHSKPICAGHAAAPAQACSVKCIRSEAEEHDRSHFALLHKIAKLETANGQLVAEVEYLKEDAFAYEEVALELEDDLNVARAESKKDWDTIAALRAAEAASVANATRLARAEETISLLRAQLQAESHAGTAQDQATATVSLSRAPALESDDSATVVVPQEAASGLTYCRLRMHAQRAAVEYRRAVREHLQDVTRERSQLVPRTCLPDLYMTPREMLDDEVMSEDESESDVCTARKKSWEFRCRSPKSVCQF